MRRNDVSGQGDQGLPEGFLIVHIGFQLSSTPAFGPTGPASIDPFRI
jgi:hypothetical protein